MIQKKLNYKVIKRFLSVILFNLKRSKNTLIVNNDSRISYNQVLKIIEKINYILGKFKREKIAIFSDKSFNYYASVLAILFSGNVWVQISPSMPINRIKQIMRLSKIKNALYDESFNNEQVFKITDLRFFLLKKILKQKKRKEIIVNNFNPKDIAMIFFTSGSTGVPKGVQISYINFISCVFYQIKNLKYRKNKEIFSDYHDTSFVMSLVVIFPAVYLNCQISPLINKVDRLLPSKHMIRNKVTVLITVPSFILFLKERLGNSKINLHNLILCGENFPYNILDQILFFFKVKNIFNCYGSTEVSPWAFYFSYKKKYYSLIKKNGQVPIGKPFKGINIKFLKNYELLINGPVMSPGYLANDTINDKKFIKIRNKIYYKTGDIVKKIGQFYFCKGRNDTQIKLRGYRVDTTEIESHIKKLKIIDYVYCYLNEKNSNKYLVLIVVTKKKILENFIINYLKKYLPNYMIPKKIVFLKNIKFNKNGKVDKIFYKKKY